MLGGLEKRVGDKYHRTGSTVKLVMAFTDRAIKPSVFPDYQPTRSHGGLIPPTLVVHSSLLIVFRQVHETRGETLLCSSHGV